MIKNNAFKIFVTVWLVYILFAYVKPESISSNLIDMAMSFVDNGNFDLRYSGEYSVDVAVVDGRYVSAHTPGAGIPVMGLYAFMRPFLRGVDGMDKVRAVNILSVLLIASVAGALLSILVYSFLRRFSIKERDRVLLSFVYAFGTMNFGYSTGLYKVTQVALYFFAAFFIFFRVKNRERSGWWLCLLAGFMLGMGVLCHPAYIPMAFLIFLYGLYSAGIKKTYAILIGAAIPLAFGAYFLKAVYGAVLLNPYVYKPADPNAFGFPNFGNFMHMFFGMEEGFFVYVTVMIFSLWGMIVMNKSQKHRHEGLLIAAIWITTGAFFSCFYHIADPSVNCWPHDSHIAIRYFMPLCPFMIIPVAFVIQRIKRVMFYFISSLSVFFAYLGAQAGLMPLSGGWQVAYALKVFGSSFGMPTLFSDTFPRFLGISVLHTYLSRPDISSGGLIASGDNALIFELVRNQIYFFGIFLIAAVSAGLIIWRIWSGSGIFKEGRSA